MAVAAMSPEYSWVMGGCGVIEIGESGAKRV